MRCISVFLHSVCQEIVVGESDIVLAGGTENMSQAPFAVRDIRWGTRFGSDLKVYTCRDKFR